MLRYIELALLGTFLLVFVSRALDASFEIGNPFLFLLFVIAVSTTFIVGWKSSHIIQYVKGKLKH
jgi:hypothetical protein